MADDADTPVGSKLLIDWKAIEEDLELEGQLFQSDEDGPIQYATLPKYVSSVGRGCRKRPNPLDIKLPRACYDHLRRKNIPRPKQPAGRGHVLRTYPGQNPSRVRPRQDTIPADNPNQPHKSSPLDEDFLGATTRGLTAEILEGKACLMEKFLGKPMTADPGAFNPFRTGHRHHHATGSLRSAQTAPQLNLNSTKHWPDLAGTWQSDYDPPQKSKSLSLQDILKSISSTPKWERASSQGSSGRGRGAAGGRKGLGMRNKGAGVAQDDSQQGKEGERKSSLEVSSASCGPETETETAPPEAAPPEAAQHEGQERSSDVDPRRNQQGEIPGGANLVQVECLPVDITEQRLTSVMYGYGPVISCDILRDSDTQQCIGIAIVRFETSEACLSAVSHLHDEDSPFHDYSEEKKIPKLVLHLLS